MRAKIRTVVSVVVAAAILFTGCAGGFSSNKISKAAKKYGMQKARSVTEFVEITEDKQYSGGYYYVSKDSSEAFHLYNAYINPGKNGFPAMYVKSFVKCVDIIDINVDRYPTTIYQITSMDESSAEKLYDAFAGYQQRDGSETFSEGEKDGYKYTIYTSHSEHHSGDNTEYDRSDVNVLVGIYLSGNTVIYMFGYDGEGNNGGCVDFFCGELGLESPVTLIG